MSEDDLSGNDPLMQQALRTVEVGEERVEQPARCATAAAIVSHSRAGRISGNTSSAHGRSLPCGRSRTRCTSRRSRRSVERCAIPRRRIRSRQVSIDATKVGPLRAAARRRAPAVRRSARRAPSSPAVQRHHRHGDTRRTQIQGKRELAGCAWATAQSRGRACGPGGKKRARRRLSASKLLIGNLSTVAIRRGASHDIGNRPPTDPSRCR